MVFALLRHALVSWCVIFAASAVAHPMSGIDHAPLSSRHIQPYQLFLDNALKRDGLFATEKIAAFLDKLHVDRSQLEKELHETILIEKFELDVEGENKAKNKAKENSLKHEYLFTMDNYLIPKMADLLEKSKTTTDQEILEGLAQDFARGYHPFFTPNNHRSYFPMDVDFLTMAWHTLFPFIYKKISKQYVEANNLILSEDDLPAVTKCLGKNLSAGHYLLDEESEALKKCDFDLSTLNPGVSPLWFPLTQEKITHIHDIDYDEYPRDGDRVSFKKVNYRGRTSAKLRVSFMRNGIEKVLKLKMGPETHTDPAASKILELVGLNQDQMLYRREIKVHLEDTSYEEFCSLFANKYGIAAIPRFITANGGNKGDEWVLINDFIFEQRPSWETRVGPFDIVAADLQNRREFRGLLVLWAWLGMADMQPINFKMLLAKTPDGMIPKLRLHDTGLSLGGPLYIRHPRNILSFNQFYKVNPFPTTFLKKKKNGVRIFWNDFGARRKNFKTSTWSDLKWMARQIAKIKEEDLRKALVNSGMPLAVADLFAIKLLIRRNEMIEAFDLKNEFPTTPVPDLKKYTPAQQADGSELKNGQLTKKALPDRNNTAVLQDTWLTFLPNILSFDIDVAKWRIADTAYQGTIGLHGLTGIKGGLSITDQTKPITFTSIPIGIGVQAILSRQVLPNPALVNADGKMQLYRVVDKIAFQFDLDSSFLKKVLDQMPHIRVSAGVQFYEREFEYIHFKDSVTEAYKSSFDLPRILIDIKKYAAYHLKRSEMVRSYERLGFEERAGVGVYFAQPFDQTEVSQTMGIRRILSWYILRDGYNQLHTFLEKTKTAYFGANLDIFTLDLFITQLPLFSLKFGVSTFKHRLTDYVFEQPEMNRKVSGDLPTERLDQEYQALCLIARGLDASSYPFVKMNFQTESKGSNRLAQFGGAWLFNKGKMHASVTTSVVLPGGDKQYFYFRSMTKNQSVGLDKLAINIDLGDFLVSKRKRTRIITEMDMDRPENFLLIVRTEDFYRVRTGEQVEKLIKDLNFRYSQSPELPFYRDYTLPPFELIDEYKKVYGLTRTFIHGEKFLEAMKAHDIKDLVQATKNHFLVNEKAQKSWRVSSQIKTVTKELKAIKKALVSLSYPKDYKVMARLYESLVSKLKTEIFGLSFFREVIGTDGIYVLGEIAGIYRTFSSLQDLQQLQRRRFAGKSWGDKWVKPPLQDFMRHHRLIPPSMFIEKTMSDRDIFGYLENVVAPDINAVFDHNSPF